MLSAETARKGLVLITGKAVETASRLVTPNADATKNALLAAAPDIITYYSDGTAALAADHYDDLRERAAPPRLYVAEPIAEIRHAKIETGVLWAVGPLYQEAPDLELATSRVAEVVQYETARPFRQTITTNTRRDPAAAGWTRITGGKTCKFCSMLAGRGAVYKQNTAHFASHPNCHCTAAPVFEGGVIGPEASVVQYTASKRTRTAADRARVREWIARNMP